MTHFCVFILTYVLSFVFQTLPCDLTYTYTWSITEIVEEETVEYIWEFMFSRYYSVMTWQTRYYNGREYLEDYTMNCFWDCLVPAIGIRYHNWLRNKGWACPPSIKLWTTLVIDGIGERTCYDRGGSIKWMRLDNWCWIWDYALNNRSTCFTWTKKVWLKDSL